LKEPRNSTATPSPASALESTAILLGRARDGDLAARERLCVRYYQLLRRFAHGRLPASARGMVETDDLVQVTVVRALQSLDRFEPRREGAFLAYLRRILINQIRDQIRSAGRAPKIESLPESLAHPAPSPLEETVGKESLQRFEAALATLPPKKREAVILRVELGFDHQQVADALGIATPTAARMYVTRAIAELAEIMKDRGPDAATPARARD
jgi:RNA polymerase sigma-70 factor (ECF subfamily)